MLGRVTGRIVAPVRNPHVEGERLLVVQPVDLAGEVAEGKELICTDRAQAGPGDLVLCNNEGSGTRVLYENRWTPVRAVVMAVVDGVDVVDADSRAPGSGGRIRTPTSGPTKGQT